MHEIAIGIDLGTTNSEVAVVKDGIVTVIPDAEGRKILPSVVGLHTDNTIIVGDIAKNQGLLYPERTIRSIKRKMGTDEKITLGEHVLTPEEISALILIELKNRAERYLQQPVSKAVITVPAYFSDRQRQATQHAGRLAGLEVLRIINEPTAAALAYENDEQTEKKILVYDLGGGTFDVSIVAFSPNMVEVLASGGNNHLGGDDFDQKIVEHLLEHVYNTQKIDLGSYPKAMARLAYLAEEAKKALSNQPYYTIEEPYLLDDSTQPIHLSHELSRENYDEMIQGFVNETLEHTHKVLREAHLSVETIDEILLVGGSTRTKLIQERLNEMFKQQSRGEIHPDLCVAMGAAIQAARLMGEKNVSVLVDVTPYTLGMQTVNVDADGDWNIYSCVPIIKKNTPIPVTKSEPFYPIHSHQEAIEFCIYQGESQDVRENTLLGQFKLKGLKNHTETVVEFQLDLNGILHVTAKEKNTNNKKSIVIDNAFAANTGKEYETASKRLKSLFGEPDEVTEGEIIELEEDNLNTDTLLQEAKQLLADEKIADSDKRDLRDLLVTVEEKQQLEDNDGLRRALHALQELMFYLRDSL